MANHKRKEQLKKVAENYFESLKSQSFATIPYSEDVVFKGAYCAGWGA